MDSLELTMERVLDTAALLHWPQANLTGGVCSPSQRQELGRLSEARLLMVEAADLRWMDASPEWMVAAKTAAGETGDLPRLSDVDLDVLALAMGLQIPLVTDDYRLQNVFNNTGGTVVPVANKASKAVWSWQLRCTGCGDVSPVPANIKRSRNQPAGECRRCGSPMLVKRKKR